ncbi:hypothetical protein HanLR1_Chr17g0650011 [Helianthus annuus]|nr:hypothetical protein HanLR1_Chr17g0650011 [Helianthus annuus]
MPDMPRGEIYAEPQRLMFSGESRYLNSLWVSGNEDRSSSTTIGLSLYRRDSEGRSFVVDKDHEEEDCSPTARVFRRGLPEWTPDVTNYMPKHFLQQECAIRCNLHGYLALPVFDSNAPLCVGVLELLTSSKYTSYAYEVQQLHNALEVSIFPPIFSDTIRLIY